MKQILKYIMVFITTLSILIIIQHLAISIPNKYIEKNMIETVEYYNGQENHEFLLNIENSPKYFKKSIIIDNYTDCLTLNMFTKSLGFAFVHISTSNDCFFNKLSRTKPPTI